MATGHEMTRSWLEPLCPRSPRDLPPRCREQRQNARSASPRARPASPTRGIGDRASAAGRRRARLAQGQAPSARPADGPAATVAPRPSPRRMPQADGVAGARNTPHLGSSDSLHCLFYTPVLRDQRPSTSAPTRSSRSGGRTVRIVGRSARSGPASRLQAGRTCPWVPTDTARRPWP